MNGSRHRLLVSSLLLVAAGCSSGGAAAQPRPSPTPPACDSPGLANARQISVELRSVDPAPVVRVAPGTVLTVTVSYRKQAMQVPKVYGDDVLCVLSGETKPAVGIRVRYLARQAGTATVISAMATATHADSPLFRTRIRVR